MIPTTAGASRPRPTGRGIDFDNFDFERRPQDDLFRFVNGTWLKTAPIADDKPGAGSFIDLRDEAEIAVKDIIVGLGEEQPADADADAARIADLYASFMDAEHIEAQGLEPLREQLATIDAVTDASGLMRLFGLLEQWGARSIVGFDADSDPGDPERCLLFLGQSGLGLPDEEYYREEQYAEIREHYATYIEKLFTLMGRADATEAARGVLALETEIAARHWDKVRTRDIQQMYNLQTWPEFTAASAVDWPAWLAASGLQDETVAEVVNCQPSFFAELAELITDEKLPQWRDWARFALVGSLAPYLPEAFVDARFHFYGTVLSGTVVNRERWKRGVALVEGVLGEAVGKLYVERHFSAVAKERMDQLVANLIEAYRRSIEQLDWMTEQTRAEALTKLEKFAPKIGFPAKWRDYSSLEVSRTEVVANVAAAARFEIARTVTKVHDPVDHDEWFMTPQTVNAYYHPLRNEIVFPAAILQPPFFDADADDAVNYGAIGAVIGHEIGHGFDDQGSTCDGDGRLRNWWTDADREAFTERTKVLIDQYNELSPEGADGETVNGELTIGENIGDLGGLGIAYQAWQIACATPGERAQRVEAPEPIDGYTGQQRLFLSWAQCWQAKFRPETVKQRLATDPHSPNEFRCNQIVRNMDAFYEAFDVQPDDELWLAPEARVNIW